MDDETKQPDDTYQGGYSLDDFADEPIRLDHVRIWNAVEEASKDWPDVRGWVASTAGED
jgi:hypothetical protein